MTDTGPDRPKEPTSDEFSDWSAQIEEARRAQVNHLSLSQDPAGQQPELPETIGQLTQLESLNLMNNELTELPEAIGQLTQLKSLDLMNNELTELPETIGQLTQLESLDVSSNQLTELPEAIGQLTQLKSLDLYNNQFRKLPEAIGQLTQLESLDISSNQLTELPEAIGQLTQLKSLSLMNIELTKLPETIGQLTQLESLHIGINQLAEWPEAIGQLTQLKSLDLLNNELAELPETIGQLTQLKSLHISSNQLTELPETIGQLTQLESLNLMNNELTELPEAIGQLTQLKSLDLMNNELTKLPETIGQLTQLESLDLTGNQLSELPESLSRLGSLAQIFLHGNNKLSLPTEVLGPSWDRALTTSPAKPSEILEYYFRVQGARRPLNEAKLILIGRGGVGKTSLVNRLVNGQFEPDEKKTEGIQITGWGFRLDDDEKIRLNIWDFGGQEIMHATHQFFLTRRSLYLLVLNGREGGEDTDAEYWLKLIESFGGGSPVIVVMNKIKEQPFDLNRRALQQKYPSIREFLKTDCEDGTGIEDLREAIQRETDHLEHLRDAFPASWFTIKDKLAGMKKNYLGFEEYREFCEQHGETDKASQEALAGYLHNLGIALNYMDDPRLQDTHVLNPRWVTNAIYKILNSDKLEKQKGEIRLYDLPEILDADEYPASMRRFIFDLMKKFDLCFSFPHDDTRYLIPELLDKQEPTETAAFKPEECLNFQYHYPVLPEGLLPRFIVRTHVLSDGMPRWRTGAILKFEDNRALVKADVQDNRVFVSVSGPSSSRRRLMAVIRSDFQQIHRDIQNLQPQEMIPLPTYSDVVVPYQELLVVEQNGMKKFPKVVHGQIIDLDVQELLNGVDLAGRRERKQATDRQSQVARLFYSYSHKDESLRNELETHLKILQRLKLVESWHDRNIEAGDDWRREIDNNLELAHIILLLVSSDFIASEYCYEKEMKRALERHKKGEALVVPIIVRDSNWTKAPFGKLQALPDKGKAVTLWEDRDSAWRNVSEGIEMVVEEGRMKPDA